MDRIELVTTLEYEALDHNDALQGALLVHAAEATTAVHKRTSEWQSDIA